MSFFLTKCSFDFRKKPDFSFIYEGEGGIVFCLDVLARGKKKNVLYTRFKIRLKNCNFKS